MAEIKPKVWKDIKAEKSQKERDWQSYEEVEALRHKELNPYSKNKLVGKRGRSKPFFKYCANCQNKFHPITRTTKLCDECFNKAKESNKSRLIKFNRKRKTNVMPKLSLALLGQATQEKKKK